MSLRVNTYKRKILAGENKDRFFYYGGVIMDGTINFDQLCENISHFCTVTKADIAAVINGLLPIIGQYLSNGHTVDLEGFGSLRLSASSRAVEDEEDFTTALMKKVKVVFNPGKALRDAAMEATFTRNQENIRPDEPCPFGHD